MPININVADNIAELVLDHPPVNAFNSQTWNELPAKWLMKGEQNRFIAVQKRCLRPAQ